MQSLDNSAASTISAESTEEGVSRNSNRVLIDGQPIATMAKYSQYRSAVALSLNDNLIMLLSSKPSRNGMVRCLQYEDPTPELQQLKLLRMLAI